MRSAICETTEAESCYTASGTKSTNFAVMMLLG